MHIRYPHIFTFLMIKLGGVTTPYGLLRALPSRNPARNSHIGALTLPFYAHSWAGNEAGCPRLCKHSVGTRLITLVS